MQAIASGQLVSEADGASAGKGSSAGAMTTSISRRCSSVRSTAGAFRFQAGRRPYEEIAFQFSHHIVDSDGRVEHAGQYLHRERGTFPNYDFLRALKAKYSQPIYGSRAPGGVASLNFSDLSDTASSTLWRW